MYKSIILIAGMALAALAIGFSASAQNASGGKALFAEHCAVCHTATPGQRSGMGPNLAGVSGRTAGTVAGFDYSPALKGSGRVWTKASLDAFLTKPGAAVPGTRMPVSISDPKVRAALVEYLLTLKK